MTVALGIAQGLFGRVALLDRDTSLVGHAHPHCHLLLKVDGPDRAFVVGDQTVTVRDDTAVLMNAWDYHRYDHPAGTERTVYLALYIEPEWIGELERAFAPQGQPALFAAPCVPIGEPIRKLRRQLADRLAAGSVEDVSALTGEPVLSMLHSHAVDGQAGCARSAPRRPPMDWRIRAALRTMQANSAGEYDFDAVARSAGLSRPHFNHLFHACIGATPAVCGNALRIERAVRRLGERRESVSDVSDALRFSAQSNFTRFFQQRTGVTPSHFRRVVQTTD